MKRVMWLVAILLATKTLPAQTGCPGCIVSLPTLPEDTIYLSEAPDGQAGMYYDQDISFRMPKTTTPVAATDPSVPPNIVIQQVTITSVTNLPPGLQWEVSQFEFNPAEQTDGCVRLCGTPLFSGMYLVEVVVDAQVFFITQSSSFTFPLYIAPSQSITEGFSLINNAGCGSVTASFVNLVPSDSVAGFSYLWDFGNGNASIQENPGPQTYSSPGVYPIQYTAIIDTSGYYLARVNILEVGCNDILGGAPDLKIGIYDNTGQEVYLSSIVQNATVPLAFDLFLPLETGNYSLRVTDNDGGLDGADDICGVVNFTRLSDGVLVDDEMSLDLNIFHQVDTIISSDTVRVFVQPQPPVIEYSSPAPYCEGDSLTLFSSYDDHFIWYQDSVPILSVTDPMLDITEAGNYWVVYTSEDGCSAVSPVSTIVFNPYPQAVFTIANNLLSIYQPEQLPESYLIEWFVNGELIPDAQDLTYCIAVSGEYRLQITDLASGCASFFEQEAAYNPAFPNCTTASTEQFEEPLRVYPNPMENEVNLSGKWNNTADLYIKLFAADGGIRRSMVVTPPAGQFAISMPVEDLPSGIYFLSISAGDGVQIFKLIRK
ncbi:MAG: T9SS type A sorting domain-containing protein [Saprospiraceae bacterium]|nr:T9SS type A sorting domain-containing protein [Saprospiraceae bacterium]